MTEEHPETPIAEAKSLSELNIHLGYIRQKIAENSVNNKANFQELKDQITLQAHNFVIQDEFKPFVKDVENLKITQKELVTFRDTLVGKFWGIGIIAGGIVAVISFIANHYFK